MVFICLQPKASEKVTRETNDAKHTTLESASLDYESNIGPRVIHGCPGVIDNLTTPHFLP